MSTFFGTPCIMMLRIPWTAKKIGTEVVHVMRPVTKPLPLIVKRRTLAYLGHINRYNDMQRAELMGKINVKRDLEGGKELIG